jgi:hypothetical protein
VLIIGSIKRRIVNTYNRTQKSSRESHCRCLSIIRERQRIRRKALTEFITSQKLGKQCALCGEDHVTKLVFHHVDPATKLFAVSDISRLYSEPAILAEIAKCVVWCRGCHSDYHNRHRKTS